MNEIGLTEGMSTAGELRFADLHNHVVPEVDDGSRSLEESLEALREFREEGVASLIATPHLYLQFLHGPAKLSAHMDYLRRGFERLERVVSGQSGMPALHFGQEICAHDDAAVRRVVDDPAVGLAGTPFMLIEFGFELEGDPDRVVQTVREAGREIIVAHPERYKYQAGVNALEMMRRWHDAGAFLQINLGSLYDGESAYGSDAERLGWQLIDEGLAHLVSSDHHCRSRPQILHRTVHAAIVQRGGRSQADLLLGENPARVVRGQRPLEVEPLCSSATGC